MKKLLFIICFVLFAYTADARMSVVMMSGSGVSSVGGTDYTADANCQGAWFMNADGSTSETDRSGNGNDLTVSASDTIPRSATVPSGYSGYSRDFESSEADYLFIADGTELDINGADQPLSIVAWIKVESVTTADNGESYIVAKHTTNNYQFLFGIDYTSSTTFSVFAVLSNSSADGTSGETVSSTGTTYALDTWYHVAFVYNDTDMRIYVNGALDCSPVAKTDGIFNGSGTFNIGTLSSSYGEFDGLIDEVAVFDRELTSSEISAIYTNGISGNKGGSD